MKKFLSAQENFEVYENNGQIMVRRLQPEPEPIGKSFFCCCFQIYDFCKFGDPILVTDGRCLCKVKIFNSSFSWAVQAAN